MPQRGARANGMATQARIHGYRTPSTGMTQKVLRTLAVATTLLVVFALARTMSSRPAPAAVSADAEVAIMDGAPERLAAAVRLRTIAHEDPAALDGAAFRALHAHLRASFPLVHARLQRETISEHSLLYTWPGTQPAAEAVLLMGHLDVVPVEPGTEQQWHEPPFSGRISDGFIWGRGAIDNKSAVVGILEAVEMLLHDGFQPAGTVYLAFGHDEEVGGMQGARRIAELLEQRSVRLRMVLDEGGVIGDGLLPGVTTPVAMIGIAEKGFTTVELRAHTPGGHSSLPPQQTAVGMLSAAIARLEAEQMSARLESPTRQLFERITPELGFGGRFVFSNLWLTERLVVSQLERAPATNAMVRTTTAPTLFHAGTKDNVLPTLASASLNFRTLPGDSVASVFEHVRSVVDDPRIEIRQSGRFTAEPSEISSTRSAPFRTIERTIQRTMPGTMVAPFQVVVVTDARHFAPLSRDVYRFLPLRLGPSDTSRMHGANERIGVREYETAIRFYRALLRDLD